MSDRFVFENDSKIEWVDKETLRYTKGELSTLVWVDYEPGFFNSGRIIRSSMLKNWDRKPGGDFVRINASDKNEILEKTKKYFASQKIKCSVGD